MRNRKKILLVVTAVMMAAALTLTAAPEEFIAVNAGYIDPETDATVMSLENQIESVEQKLINLESSLNSTENAIASETANKEYIDSKLTLVGQDISLSKELITAYDDAIAAKEKEISDQEAAVQAKYKQFEEWIKAFYTTGEISYLQMIFGNEDFNDMLTTTEYIAEIMDSNNQLMAELEAQVKDLQLAKERLEVYRSQQVTISNDLKSQEATYEELAAASANYLNNLRSNQTAYESEYTRMQQESEALNLELEAELERIALQNAVYVGGTYMWPVDTAYSRVSSGYGWRSYGGGEFHLGIDIPCDYGANVYASNSGTVIKAESHYSYGNYVLIDHGGGQATLYAHNSSLLVSVGDVVSKGDVIALAGSTGDSTGNHVHFEVRINGVTTDPLEYVTQP